MIREDHIVIPSKNTQLLVKTIKDYFDGDKQSRSKLEIVIYKHRREEKSLVIFNSKMDNQHFVFLHGYLTTEDEFWKEGYCGWFHISDKISPNVPDKRFGESKENDSFSRNVMLGLEMTADDVVGYTADDYRLQFNYDGTYEMTPAKGYQMSTETLEHYEYCEELKFQAQAAHEYNKEGETAFVGPWSPIMILFRLIFYPLGSFLIFLATSGIVGNYQTAGIITLGVFCFFLLIEILVLREIYLKRKNKK